MNATMHLHRAGQSLWLDNITRDLLTTGTLRRYIDELSVTGLTSNPTIYDKAIATSEAYDDVIRDGAAHGLAPEDIFFELALDDLREAADLFRPTFDRTRGVDGFVSLEVSPLLADEAATTLQEAVRLHAKGNRPNLFIKIPGTAAGLGAIEEAIFAGVPVNVTLLFSEGQYVAAFDAYTRGIERRIEAGLDPGIASVASVFVSRWDGPAAGPLPEDLHLRLGIAMARRSYVAYRRMVESDRWQRLMNEGARPQRLLFASTGTKDPSASDVLYVEALAAPHTVDTMPEPTLIAFAGHGRVDATLPLSLDEGAESRIAVAKLDVDAIAGRLQADGAQAFVRSWQSLLERIESKAATGTAAAV